ncbi:hypothetical protein EGI22_22760 [Lacihabitans sp. LS3-19]|uniref:hypothetical protein n=1 Tax=Lacihabitans sp. LS3-19 TaxID=2487335 RepID=UPI0020CE6244|nr:hypothetical protein [Lacihabitans sp. LS3-19]MCP9770737.1 hypothetical protein [Lacihabitans sp. LS3-19]
MGKTKINFLDTFIENLASVSLFIESKGLTQTAILFKEKVYDFIENLNFDKTEYSTCRDPERASSGLKCILFNKKYTIVFYQMGDEVLIIEFVASKMIH